MIRSTTALVLILAASAGGAYAAGPAPASEPIVSSPPPPPPPPFWEGAYIGAQLGYAYGEFDIDDAIDGDDDDDGFIGGITAGYLWSLNNGWYIGPEFQYDWADKLTVRDADTGDTASFDEMARLKLIVGYELGNGLLFGSGGAAYGSLDSAGDIFDIDSDTNWVLGFGYDWRVGDNWSVGAEYQYHDFDDINVNTIHLRTAYRF